MVNPEMGPREPEKKFVRIDEEHQAMETNEFSLNEISPKRGNLFKFSQIYFETKSGNVYAIVKVKENESNPEPINWGIIDGKKNLAKGKEMKAKKLTEEDLENGILKIDEPFKYGKSGITTEIKRILCVDNHKIRHNIENLENIAGSEKDLQLKFSDIIAKKQTKK